MEKILNKILDKLDALEQGQAKLEQGYAKLEQGQDELKQELRFVKNVTTRIEIEHGKQLGLLYDGYLANTQAINENSERLSRLEKKVDRLSTVQLVHDDEIKVHDAEIKKFAK